MRFWEQMGTIFTINLRLLVVCPRAASPGRKLLRLEWCWFVLGWWRFLLPVEDNGITKQIVFLIKSPTFFSPIISYVPL